MPDLPKGPSNNTLEAYTNYSCTDAGKASNEVLVKTVSGNGKNLNEDAEIIFSVIYVDLIKNLKIFTVPLPANELLAKISD